MNDLEQTARDRGKRAKALTDPPLPVTSVFGVLLARLKGPRRNWPDEDLVSELTAAVINAVPGLGGFLIANLPPPKDGPFKPALRNKVAARTQVYTAKTTKRHVDIELAAVPECLIWVEVKIDAPESGDQLAEYNKQLEIRAGQHGFKDHRLIYLTPTGERPKDPGLVEIAAVSWQELAVCLKDWRERSPDDPAGWILDDYLRYLKERGLAMADPLDSDLPTTVQRYRDAFQTLEHLHSLVIDRLPADWKQAGAEMFSSGVSVASEFREWPQWWGVYKVRAREAIEDEFDFALESQTELNSIECGLIWRFEWEPDLSWVEDEDFVEAVRGIEIDHHPFDLFRHETLVRLGRQLPLSEITAEGMTLTGQAKLIADFIEDTFTGIESRLGLLRSRD